MHDAKLELFKAKPPEAKEAKEAKQYTAG